MVRLRGSPVSKTLAIGTKALKNTPVTITSTAFEILNISAEASA